MCCSLATFNEGCLGLTHQPGFCSGLQTNMSLATSGTSFFGTRPAVSLSSEDYRRGHTLHQWEAQLAANQGLAGKKQLKRIDIWKFERARGF